MVVSENASNLPVQVDPLDPVLFLRPLPSNCCGLLRRQPCPFFACQLRRGCRRLRGLLAQVRVDIAAIPSRIKSRDHSLTVRTQPHSYVERNAFRCLFRRTRASYLWSWLPLRIELLRRE